MHNDYPRTGRTRCGFCLDNLHNKCIVHVKMGTPSNPVIWTCGCGCNQNKNRCVECGRTGDGIRHGYCTDKEACNRIKKTKKGKKPYYYRKGNDMQQQPTPPMRPIKASHFCLCCDQVTKGGRFLPGHDARFIRMAVEGIQNKNDLNRIRRKLGEISEPLLTKFDKAWHKEEQYRAAREAAK